MRAGRPRSRLLVLVAVVSISLVGAVAAAPAEAHLPWQWPLHPQPPVARPFEPPAASWSAGHRGVDLRGDPLQPVRSVARGHVTFAGVIAGRGVVVVHHGSLRSTYQPVTAAVHVSQAVAAGEVVGLLQTAGSHCAPQACLHLGVRRGDVYVDPLALLGPQGVILKPLDGDTRATDHGESLLPPNLEGSLPTPDHNGAWPQGAETRYPVRAPSPFRGTAAAQRSVEVGVVAALGRVVTSLLTTLQNG